MELIDRLLNHFHYFVFIAQPKRNIKVPVCVFGLSRDEHASHTNP